MRTWPWLGLACFTTPVWAQDPAAALAAQWNTICATAVGGTALGTRCGETIASTAPDPNRLAAEGQNLNQLPAEGRASTALDEAEAATERVELGQGWGFALNAQFGRTKRDDNAREAAFEGDSQSLQANLDWTPNAELTLGASVGVARQRLDFVGGRSFTESDGTQTALFLNWRLSEKWSFDGFADWGRGDSDSRREIAYTLPTGANSVQVSGESRGSSKNRRQGMGLSLGYSIANKNGWEHGLRLGVDQNRSTLRAFDEVSSTGLALSIPTRRIISRQAHLGWSVAGARSYEWGVWQPLFGVSWTHEMANPVRTLTVNLAEDAQNNAIAFQTAAPDRSWGGLDVGSAFVIGKGHSMYVQYSRRFAHDFLQDEVLALGWRVEL